VLGLKTSARRPSNTTMTMFGRVRGVACDGSAIVVGFAETRAA
jgi:hypothetical protein